MTDDNGNDKFESDLLLKITKLEGKIDTLTQLFAAYQTSYRTLENRIWGLLVGVLAAFGTAIMAMIKRS